MSPESVKESRKRNFSQIYIGFFLSLYLLYIVIFYNEVIRRSQILYFGFSSVVMPAIEIVFFCMLGLLAWRYRNGLLKIPAIIVVVLSPAIVMAIYSVQQFAGYISGDYISVVAIESLKDSELVTKPIVLWLLSAGIFVWIFTLTVIWQYYKSEPVRSLTNKFIYTFVFVTILFISMFDSRSKAGSIVTLAPDQSPITSLLRKYRDIYKDAMSDAAFEARSVNMMAKLNPSLYDFTAQFPFLKDQVYSSPLPFSKNSLTAKNPNLIVIFTEGLSARFLGVYGGLHPDLTPNLDRFASQSMIVKNYYNHTAATFRGVKGQLASGYPRIDGVENGGFTDPDGSNNAPQLLGLNYQTIPKILAKRGYETDFLSVQNEDDNFNNMLRSLGFQNVYNFSTMANFVEGKPLRPSSGTSSMTDHDLATALINYLKGKESTKTPFMMSTYNIGTHAFLDVDENGMKYGDGQNIALNRVHNYDAEMGRFLDYFLSSKLADSTILVFTTDHASYPEPPVVSALQEPSYKPYFVDQVPLLIYAKGYKFPSVFDAHYRTSLDLAPTLLHLLSVNSVPNAFLGSSLFETPPAGHVSLSSVPMDFFRISSKGVELATALATPDDRFSTYKDLVEIYWYLERNHRIFPTDSGQ